MRALWKPVPLSPLIYSTIKKNRLSRFANINSFLLVKRSLMLNRLLIGLNLSVHNGRYYTPLSVQLNHLRLKAGDFFFSKKFSPIHSGTSFVFETKRLKNMKGKTVNKKAFNLKNKSKLTKKRR